MGCIVESANGNGSIRSFIGRGFRGLIVDVSGLRAFPHLQSGALEGIAVEVKRGTKRTALRSLVQTSQYGRLAHLSASR
jgi:hypothetical protein